MNDANTQTSTTPTSTELEPEFRFPQQLESMSPEKLEECIVDRTGKDPRFQHGQAAVQARALHAQQLAAGTAHLASCEAASAELRTRRNNHKQKLSDKRDELKKLRDELTTTETGLRTDRSLLKQQAPKCGLRHLRGEDEKAVENAAVTYLRGTLEDAPGPVKRFFLAVWAFICSWPMELGTTLACGLPLGVAIGIWFEIIKASELQKITPSVINKLTYLDMYGATGLAIVGAVVWFAAETYHNKHANLALKVLMVLGAFAVCGIEVGFETVSAGIFFLQKEYWAAERGLTPQHKTTFDCIMIACVFSVPYFLLKVGRVNLKFFAKKEAEKAAELLSEIGPMLKSFLNEEPTQRNPVTGKVVLETATRIREAKERLRFFGPLKAGIRQLRREVKQLETKKVEVTAEVAKSLNVERSQVVSITNQLNELIKRPLVKVPMVPSPGWRSFFGLN